jgi:hypothetical protein
VSSILPTKIIYCCLMKSSFLKTLMERLRCSNSLSELSQLDAFSVESLLLQSKSSSEVKSIGLLVKVYIWKTGWTFGASLFGSIFGYAILKPLSKSLPRRLGGGYFGLKENVCCKYSIKFSLVMKETCSSKSLVSR